MFASLGGGKGPRDISTLHYVLETLEGLQKPGMLVGTIPVPSQAPWLEKWIDLISYVRETWGNHRSKANTLCCAL